MNPTPLLHCEDLVTKLGPEHFEGQPLNLTASNGDLVSMIGKDYSGKSDWLKTIAGVDNQYSGELYLNGINTKDLDMNSWVQTRTKFAYVKSDTALLSAANGIQNILLPAKYHNIGDLEEVKEKAIKLLASIDADKNLEVLPAYIRKDQCFKIAVVRALVLDPEVLFIDNPFNLLGVVAANKFKKFLMKLAKEKNMLIVMVTPDIKYAVEQSDKIIFVSRKQIYVFNDRKDMLSCDTPEIKDFLTRTQIKC